MLQGRGCPDHREREGEGGEGREEEGGRKEHKENTFPKPMTEKMKGADYHEFLKQSEFKDWSFRGLYHGWC